jgi:sugar O-acyltransferase (sialic acid O-acetyltransferase NeuD family)
MKTEEIVIIGAVGTALNIAEQINDAFHKHNHHQKVIGFCIDSFPVNSVINELPVVSTIAKLNDYLINKPRVKLLYALFRPDIMKARFQLFQQLNIARGKLTNFIHPHSYYSSSSLLGVGNVILSNTTIQSNVSIGDLNIINSNVTIEHDTKIGDGNFIAANVAIGAEVSLGVHNFIGLNSSIREKVSLNEVFVGMHSLVLSNFRHTKIFGIPATEK